ncbi:hypothetical protein IKF88_00650 [Candidatus Saccharibacteria bacterium]|nr:hypothetical protein [Candidatus Saccharibacteria bacterium]
MARYRLASLDELGDYTISPTSDQTQLWNAIGRNAGSQTGDNYFTKRAKSIDNAIGTTGAAIAATAKDAWENLSTDTLRQERRNNMNDIARKYGYNSWDDWQDAYANAHQAGDTAKIAEMEPQLQEFQAQANTNAAKANEKAANYRDYMQNNDVSKRINQDQGKFLGSAINTLSTATDVLGLTNGPVSNAIQGGIEGIADELEQNGLQNFDWGRAGQNVAIGAATGGVVGGLNKGLTSALAKNGGNLFKGGNFVTRGLNDLGSKTALGRGISTIATGAGRGALSGAVGGATGAGLSSALNGVEIGQGFANALQGAAQGAGQGAFAGATMAGTNMALNKTPVAGKFLRDVNQAQEQWQRSGKDFNEKLTNTLTSGDSSVGEWLQGNKQSKLLGAAGRIGNRITDVSGTPAENSRVFSVSGTDEQYTFASTDTAPRGVKQAAVDYAYETDGRIDPSELTEFYNAAQKFEGDIHSLAEQYSMETDGRVDPNEYVDFMMQSSKTGNTRSLNIGDRKSIVDYLEADAEGIPQTAPAYRAGEAFDEAVADLRNNYTDTELAEMLRNTNNSKIRGVIQGALKTNTPTTAAGWLKKAGERIVEDANNRGVGLSIRDTNNRLAFAGNEGDQVNGLGGETNGLFSSSVIKGGAPDGGNLVKADYPLPKNASKRAIGQTIRDVIKSRFQGNSYDVGDTGIKAAVNSRTVSEMGYQQPNMNDSDFNRKGSMAGNLDELLENMTNARRIENKKPDIKPNVDYYISGRVAVDVGDGEIYNPRVDVEVKNGRPVAYNISDIKKYPGATPQGVPSGGDQPAVDYRGTYGRETIIPQGEQDVKPETEVYRTLTGESEPLRTSKEYEYRQKRNQKLLDQYGTIDKPTAKAVRAVETVGQIADAGFEKPAEVEAVIKRITGSDGTVNKLNRKVISNAGQVNTMDGVDPNTTIEDFIDQQVRLNGLYGTNDGNAITTEIKAVLGQLPSRRNGTITGLDDAQDTFDVIQMLEKHGANYKGRSGSNYATSTPYKEQKAAVIDAVATVLKDRIYDASDISKVVTPEVISDMKSWYPENKKWATWVDENIATAKTGADLRAAQAPFVRMGRLIENTIVNSGTFGSKVPRQLLRIATSNPLGVALNTAELLSETPVGRRLQAWGYDKLADRAARKTATTGGTPTPTTPTQVPTTGATTTATEYNPATQIYNSIGRQQGLINGEQARTAQYLADATNAVASDGTLEGLVAPTTAPSTSVYNSVYGTPSTGTTAGTATNYFPQTGDYWTDLLGRAMSSAIDADDADAFGSLYAMYQDALSKLDSKSSQKLTATQQRANAALNSLERLAQMTPDLGYNLSNIPVIGDIATFGGNDYESEAKSLAQQIGYMVSGANIKEEEAYNIGKAYVPQPFDSESTRRNKLQRAREIIAQYQNGYATE